MSEEKEGVREWGMVCGGLGVGVGVRWESCARVVEMRGMVVGSMVVRGFGDGFGGRRGMGWIVR